jgi:hypothetical protein
VAREDHGTLAQYAACSLGVLTWQLTGRDAGDLWIAVLVAVAVFAGWAVADHQTFVRRQRAAEREHTHADDEADEDEEAAA